MTLTDYARQDTKEDILKLCIRRGPQQVLECLHEVMTELKQAVAEYEKPKSITLSNTIEEPTLLWEKEKEVKVKKPRGRASKKVKEEISEIQ